jgi:hypothetical protein
MRLPKGATKRKVVGPPFWRVCCFPTLYITSPRFNCIRGTASGFVEERVAVRLPFRKMDKGNLYPAYRPRRSVECG